jgi:ABC-type lipoprotein release transport system permease subunit
MTFRDLAKTSFGNLGRHKVRTALSAVGVTVGILTIVTMLSLGIGVRQEMTRVFQVAGLETLRVRPTTEDRTVFNQYMEPKRTVLITPALVEELRAREDVVEVHPRIFLPWGLNVALKVGEEMVRVQVREPAWEGSLTDPFTPPPEIVAGEDLAEDDQGDIVIGVNALEALGYEGQAEFEGLIGQEVTLTLKAPRGDAQTYRFRVVGMIDTHYEDSFLWAHVGLADSLALKAWWYNDPDILEHEGYDELIVKAASLTDAAQIVEQLAEERGFQVESLQMVLDIASKVMIIIQTMLGSVGGLALLVASIGIANTMIMAVYERTREIGILKAIGASPGDIRVLFMAEASLIGLLGGVVGTIGGWLLGLGLNRGILAYLHWKEVPVTGTFFVVAGWLVLLALGFATVVGLLAGLYPAARAARLDPLEALRYE